MKIAFILPYFGEFPNYFSLFLKSCKYNSTIDWLLFTDNKTRYNYPDNVKIYMMSYTNMKEYIQSFYNYEVCLNTKYSICAFRAAYGELFHDYLEGYDFWGFCDCDLIWGNLRGMITDEILNKYDKISWRGHMTLFRNNEYVNSIYKNTLENIPSYKECITSKLSYYLNEEVGLNYLFKDVGIPVCEYLKFADFKIRIYNFEMMYSFDGECLNAKYQVFVWCKGRLFRKYIDEFGSVNEDEFLYIHFLKRPMSVCADLDTDDCFLIVPNKFLRYESLSIENLKKYGKKRFYYSYWIKRISPCFIINKIKYMYTHRNCKNYYYYPSSDHC